MNRYAGNQYKENKEPSKFLARFANLSIDKESLKNLNDKEDFKKSYRAGRIAFASAQKHMTLKSCGLDRFIEANTDIVWSKEGDNIIRVDNDLDWVTSFLEQEGNR